MQNGALITNFAYLKTKNACGCDCGEALKEHLKKCAGYGQRPPLFEGLKANTNSSCEPKAAPTAGRCCPPPPPKIVIFKPECEVPPTETFTCPADCCRPPKPQKCCPPPPPPCADENANAGQQQKCPEIITNSGSCSSDGSQSSGYGSGGKCPAMKRGARCQPPKPDEESK